MNGMTEMQKQALERLGKESKEKLSGHHQSVMAGPVAAALKDFCRQNDEFARAVVQGGDFKGCMEAVAKNCGDALSDLEAYRRAVSYYFPGAQVDMKLSIRMSEYERDEAQEGGKPAGLLLDLADFL